jgi:hypothetical protein
MRVRTSILVLALLCGLYTLGRAKLDAAAPVASVVSTHTATSTASPTTAKIDFATQIRPLLETRCTPCHFAGGKMYQRLPFDRAETIYALGNKLFTRIKDEHEQRLLREFLAQQSEHDQANP